MAREDRKFANYLLIAALVLTPVRATWAFQDNVSKHSSHPNISMAMDSAGATDTECCCSEDACMPNGCAPCNSINPMVPMPECVARILQIQMHISSLVSNFHSLELTPPLHPPKA